MRQKKLLFLYHLVILLIDRLSAIMRRAQLQPVPTVKPSRTITLGVSLYSSDIYTQSSTGGAWNDRHVTYTAEFLVETSADYPTVPGGLYTFFIDRRVQLRKDETFSQDHARWSIAFPAVPRQNEDATGPTSMEACVIFDQKNGTTTKCRGTGYSGPNGGSCGPISFTPRDGDLDTLSTAPWSVIDITLMFPVPVQKVDEKKSNTTGSLRQMLGSASDCIVIASDGRQFHAHRSVLSAHSPVFAAMFEHDSAEKQDGTVKIADVIGNVMEEFLVFLYNHTVDGEQIKEFLEDLYHAADKYDVPNLRTICEDTMCTTLDARNAVQRLAFAQDRGMKKLKMKAIDF